MIRIYCDAADAVLRETQTLTAGMINYPEVLLTFSDDWDGYGKAVIVRAGEVEKAALIVNNKFIVPSECLAESGVSLIVGISGSDGVHTIPTIWCSCGEIMDGTDAQDSTAIGDATPSLVDQMLGYAQDVVDEAQMLQNYIVKTVVADDSNADNFDEASVNVTDSGEGANRTLTFYFSNIKGRSVAKLLFTQSGENRGRLQVQLEGADPVNYDGVKDALDAIATAMSDADTAETERAEAEDLRDQAEEQRDLAERGRAAAETARDNAESNRAEAERTRDANEGTRIANEEARETNENTRESNEAVRSDAETARANAESARATEFAQWQEEEESFGLKSEGYAIGEQNGVPVGSGSEYYHNNAQYYAEYAKDQKDLSLVSKQTAEAKAIDSEAWAVGQREGVDVGQTDETYQNNSKYYADQASDFADAALDAANRAIAATGLEIDTVLDASSVNPVRNMAITEAIIDLDDAKVDKVTGKQLSTEDYTTTEKNKLAGIASGAQVNTVTGIKGDAESTYRQGNVNLTPANIGAVPTDRTVNGKALSSNITLASSDIGDDSGAGGTNVKESLAALKGSLNSKCLYLTGIACSATTGNFVNYSNSAITTSHVLAECVFANPAAITTDVTWNTDTAGKLILNGTCTAATTVNVVLIKKDN